MYVIIGLDNCLPPVGTKHLSKPMIVTVTSSQLDSKDQTLVIFET